MDKIIDNWWQVLALLGGIVIAFWGIALGIVHFLKVAKESGVDEVTAGPVKVDFDDKEK